MKALRASCILPWILASAIGFGTALAQVDPPTDMEEATASVAIDGRTLFRVRGISSYPAATRANDIAARIIDLARDTRFDASIVRAIEGRDAADIVGGQRRIMTVFEADAALEGIDHRRLAAHYAGQVRIAIAEYRRQRSADTIKSSLIKTAIATAVFIPAVWLLARLARRLTQRLEVRYKNRVPSVSIQSFHILHAQRIWTILVALWKGVLVLLIALTGYLYVEFVLSLFVWTRPVAERLLDHLVRPLLTIGHAVLTKLPDLLFLFVLFVVGRYALKLLRLFFDALGRGSVTLEGFEPQWSEPSYRLARLGVIMLTAVVAYPYIPGSGSEAFKGLSILLGLMFSIASSSYLANIVAGYALIYRRAFREGDRIRIDEVTGDVVDMRLQVTRLRSLKGEEVIVPNSAILNSKVINYSSLANNHKLILHTSICIGYDVPWRKVEFLLLKAADITPGLLREPAPFVSQKKLGDFAIAYELNAYCDDPHGMGRLYTELHRSILDLFNEHGVQIMTPAYHCDSVQPKVVPREQWFAVPTTASKAER